MIDTLLEERGVVCVTLRVLEGLERLARAWTSSASDVQGDRDAPHLAARDQAPGGGECKPSSVPRARRRRVWDARRRAERTVFVVHAAPSTCAHRRLLPPSRLARRPRRRPAAEIDDARAPAREPLGLLVVVRDEHVRLWPAGAVAAAARAARARRPVGQEREERRLDLCRRLRVERRRRLCPHGEIPAQGQQAIQLSWWAFKAKAEQGKRERTHRRAG